MIDSGPASAYYQTIDARFQGESGMLDELMCRYCNGTGWHPLLNRLVECDQCDGGAGPAYTDEARRRREHGDGSDDGHDGEPESCIVDDTPF